MIVPDNGPFVAEVPMFLHQSIQRYFEDKAHLPTTPRECQAFLVYLGNCNVVDKRKTQEGYDPPDEGKKSAPVTNPRKVAEVLSLHKEGWTQEDALNFINRVVGEYASLTAEHILGLYFMYGIDEDGNLKVEVPAKKK